MRLGLGLKSTFYIGIFLSVWSGKKTLRIPRPRFIPIPRLLMRQNNLTNRFLRFDRDALPPQPAKPAHLSAFLINTVCTDWLIGAVRTNKEAKMTLGCFYIQNTAASLTSAKETSAVIWTAAPGC